MRKIDCLEELWHWILNTNALLHQNQTYYYQTQQVHQIISAVKRVSESIGETNSFYANELLKIIVKVFPLIQPGVYGFNPTAFGELYIIIKHLNEEPENTYIWLLMHPRIVKIAKDLYLDGHYAAAANRSFVEVETRLRELFMELKPGIVVPGKVGDIIGALLSENGTYHFCDTSTKSGKDYQRGIHSLFEGSFLAYRNPSSHENQTLSKGDALDQIMLASQLMKVLENSSDTN